MSSNNKILIFDAEGDNLAKDITKLHCICTQDLDTLEVEAYYGSEKEIYKGLLALYNADCIVGHNITGFDIPAFKKLYPKWTYKSFHDTFLLSCILKPLRLSHSIESYAKGYKVENEDWSCLTHNMVDRCVIDTMVCTKIFKDQLKVLQTTTDYDDTIEVEYKTAINHTRQIKARVNVDIPLVYSTLECLDAEMEALRECIDYRLPLRCVQGKGEYKKLFNKDGTINNHVVNYFGGVPCERVIYE